jgi:hypothetical protein
MQPELIKDKNNLTTAFYLINFIERKDLMTCIFVDTNNDMFYKLGEHGGTPLNKLINVIQNKKADLYLLHPPKIADTKKTDQKYNTFYWVEFKNIKKELLQNQNRALSIVYIQDESCFFINQEELPTINLLHNDHRGEVDIFAQVEFPPHLKTE